MRNLIVMAVLLGTLAGCWSVEPQLDPFDPPPNIPVGMLLLEVPEDLVEATADEAVLADRDRALSSVNEPNRAQQIRDHQVVTGMSAQEVIWVFGSHPTGVRSQGPPGGHTLLWEVPRGLGFGRMTLGVFDDDTGRGNYWVRLDERGLTVAAGRN